MQLVGFFGELRQQLFSGFRGQSIGNPDKVSALAACSLDHCFHRNCRTQEYSAPTRSFRQAQKARHACNMDAFPQCGGKDGFHQYSPFYYRLVISG
jgi:hypothetical protein